MLVTDVRIKLVRDKNKLLGFATIIISKCFVVRDIKIIQGDGEAFIAMPARRITDHCKKCGSKNHLQAK